jgi:hypothetical protein
MGQNRRIAQQAMRRLLIFGHLRCLGVPALGFASHPRNKLRWRFEQTYRRVCQIKTACEPRRQFWRNIANAGADSFSACALLIRAS